MTNARLSNEHRAVSLHKDQITVDIKKTIPIRHKMALHT
jgi:hypothetical protein